MRTLTTPFFTPRHAVRVLCTCLAVLLGSLGLVLVSQQPAAAEARVTVQGQPQPDKESTLKVSGTGFQSVKNGFGGIYVLFGTTRGTWQPSQGGKTGQNYMYAYDDESKPAGYQLFVTFPGSSTAAAANGGALKADGTWSSTIKVSGSKFATFDRNQNKTEVDCSKEQCGIITVGAHGVVNGNNETFTPVNFASSAKTATTTEKKSNASASKETAAAANSNSSGLNNNSAGSGGSTATQPTEQAAPAVASQAVSTVSRNLGLITLLVAVGIVVALCLIALAVGVGSYMATKSLLLGVNPEALERVRGQRAKRQIAAEHKRKRNVEKYRAKQENKTRQAERAQEAKAARMAMASPDPSYTPGFAPDSSSQNSAPAGPMRFFDLIESGKQKPKQSAPNGEAAQPRGLSDEESPTREFSQVGTAGASLNDGSKH